MIATNIIIAPPTPTTTPIIILVESAFAFSMSAVLRKKMSNTLEYACDVHIYTHTSYTYIYIQVYKHENI